MWIKSSYLLVFIALWSKMSYQFSFFIGKYQVYLRYVSSGYISTSLGLQAGCLSLWKLGDKWEDVDYNKKCEGAT